MQPVPRRVRLVVALKVVLTRYWAALCVASGMVLSPCLTQAYAQRVQSTGADSACRCRIELERVLRIDTLTDDGASASIFARLEMNGRGQFLVAPVRSGIGSVIARLGPGGEVLQPFVGAGIANGFGQVRDFHTTPLDSLLVLHQSDITLLNPQGAALRSRRLPADMVAYRFLRLRDGRVVLNSYDARRPAFVLLSQMFAEVRQFGPTVPPDDAQDLSATQYRLADLGDGRFVAAKETYRYAIEIWDTSGTKVRDFGSSRSWFQPWTRQQWLDRGPRSAPFARIQGVYFEAPRRLWIIAEVPDARTPTPGPSASAAGRARPVGEMGIVPVDQYDSVFDTVLEVVDVETGRVLVSQRFDQHIRTFSDRGLLYSLHQGSGTRLVLQVWRPLIVPDRQ